MSARRKKEFPNASWYKDRLGVRRWRYRKRGFSVELGTEYASPDFVRRYESAASGCSGGLGAGVVRMRPRSISHLIAEYYKSREFLLLKDSTKKTYRGILEALRNAHGEKLVSTLRPKHVETLLAEKIGTPAAGNNLRLRLMTLMNLAIRLEWRSDNPVAHSKPYEIKSRGFHTWSEEDIGAYYCEHKERSLAHTAMTLMLYTGAARADVVRLGWHSVENGRISYRRQKTDRSDSPLIDIPIHPKLQSVISSCDMNSATFLQTRRGQSRSPFGFGNQMRDWCDEAGLPNCTAHGLRKAIARRLAEAGATPHEIMAVTGHASLQEVMRYTLDANRSLLADVAFQKMG